MCRLQRARGQIDVAAHTFFISEKYNQLEHEKNLLFETASGHKCTCFHLIPYGKCSLHSKDVYLTGKETFSEHVFFFFFFFLDLWQYTCISLLLENKIKVAIYFIHQRKCVSIYNSICHQQTKGSDGLFLKWVNGGTSFTV